MLASGGGAPDEVRYSIVHHTRGAGLELGTGPLKAFPHFIGVRRKGDKTVGDAVPELVVEKWEEIVDSVNPASLDFVFVWGDVHVTNRLRIGILDLLKDRGYYVRSAGGKIELMQKCKVLDNIDDLTLLPAEKPEGKTACVVRYGAIGDVMQSAHVMRELKQLGYHVTMMCEPGAQELMLHDPHIDAFLVQDRDQIPNHELGRFWGVWRKRFDKFVNLCESIEGTLIKLPGRADHMFPDALRREVCDHNYLEFMTKMAELPFGRPEHRFYASEQETAKARAFIDGLADRRPFVIMWALSGSSVHKAYPHMDAVMARILSEIPNAHILTVGDHACTILETGWEKEPRVHRLSGELAIRDTLALAQQCDLVIGPETGVLNAVAFESMPKVVFLSHSSVKNLTRDWTNTESLVTDTEKVPCYPCHRLHFDATYCPRESETHAAMCAFHITPNQTWEAVKRAYLGRETVNRILTP